MEDLIQSWNEEAEGIVESHIIEDLNRYRERGRFSERCIKLSLFDHLMEAGRVPVVIRALCRVIPQVSRIGGFWSTECDYVEKLFFQLLEDRADPAQIQPLLEEAVRECQLLYFAVRITQVCQHANQHGVPRIAVHVNAEALRRITAEQLRAYYVGDQHDIFEELAETEWGFVLDQWGTDWMTHCGENRQIVQGYVMNVIDHHPEYLGQLLHRFVERPVSSDQKIFRLHDFAQLYDLSAVSERLERFGDRALTTPEAREAVQLFQQEYAKPQTDQRQE